MQDLDLSHNQIKEIRGLEHLPSLQRLHLEGNPIAEVQGLEQTNLYDLSLHATLVPNTVIEGIKSSGPPTGSGLKFAVCSRAKAARRARGPWLPGGSWQGRAAEVEFGTLSLC